MSYFYTRLCLDCNKDWHKKIDFISNLPVFNLTLTKLQYFIQLKDQCLVFYTRLCLDYSKGAHWHISNSPVFNLTLTRILSPTNSRTRKLEGSPTPIMIPLCAFVLKAKLMSVLFETVLLLDSMYPRPSSIMFIAPKEAIVDD